MCIWWGQIWSIERKRAVRKGLWTMLICTRSIAIEKRGGQWSRWELCDQGKGSKETLVRDTGQEGQSLNLSWYEAMHLGRITELSGPGSRWSDGTIYQNSKTMKQKLALKGEPIYSFPDLVVGRTGWDTAGKSLSTEPGTESVLRIRQLTSSAHSGGCTAGI